MKKIVEDNIASVVELCKRFHACRLELFGSALRNDFDMHESDIDFLVEFDKQGIINYADNYFGLQEALEILFSRPVDLVVISSLKNPYFIQSIEQDRAILYAA